MNSYRHTQIGWAVIVPVLLVATVSVMTLVFVPQSRKVLPWIATFFVVVLALFSTLTVIVTGDALECRFGVGLVRRRIAWRDLRRAEAVRNRWWYGWGIRVTPHGWLWNVSGLDAVELTFATGKKFRLGTDDPKKLLAAIRAAQSVAAPATGNSF